MSSVVLHQYRTPEPVTADDTDYNGLFALANELVKTGFLPDHIKTGGQCAAIILAGRELGLEPMLALRSIGMIKGKIVVAADAQLALFKSKGGRARFEELTDTTAVLVLRHPNGDGHTETFTIEDAKRANLLGNSNWKTWPRAMLRSRAITAGLKSVGFEPTSGVYDPDEAQHFTPSPSVSTPVVVTGPVAMQEMTLADALTVTVSDNPAAFKGKGADTLDSYSTEHLAQLKSWFEEKLLDGHRDDFALRVEAATLILDAREADQGKLELAATSAPSEPVADVLPEPTAEVKQRVHQKRGTGMEPSEYRPDAEAYVPGEGEIPF